MTTRILALVLACAVASAQDATCLKCHADKAELTKALKGKALPADRLARLVFDRQRYKQSVHASRGCAECHFDYDTFPHSDEAESVKCAECHEDQSTAVGKSIHGKQTGDKKIDCASCHGVHDILKPSHRESSLNPLNVHRTCGACHFEKDPSAMKFEEFFDEKLMNDVHGTAILSHGLRVSATCTSCHGGHDIHAKGDPASPLARVRVHQKCGGCHVRAMERHQMSVHRIKPKDPELSGAACTDCHKPHHIKRAGEDFKVESVEACGACHKQRLGTFRNTYHGKISQLGYGEKAASCKDCHRGHLVLPSSDENSSMHISRRVETCGKCHQGAHESFVTYKVHADPSDKENFPGLYAVYSAMTLLLIGVFSAVGLHAVLWLIRSLAAREWRHAKFKGGPYVRRWSDFYTSLHVGMMLSFLGVGATGLPLHYANKEWARDAMDVLGGPVQAAWLHRVAAILMLGTIAAYLGHLFWRVFIKREKGLWFGPNTMLPRVKDLQDLVGMFKWFFFIGEKPKFDRWTYWEKLDFWAVFWGIVVIGGSGLVMWFPVASTRVLPGWAINVAHVVHGHEALLAIGFIFSIHIFHTQFRPEKFPMDIMFFSGRMPEEEFRYERPVEYERAVAAGALEALRDREPGPRTKRVGHMIGVLALVLGISFVVAMVAAAVL